MGQGTDQKSTHLRVFIDTNIFIEMRDLRDLDWRLMFPNLVDLHIIISVHVIDELDRLKTDRLERKRRRALAALQIVDETIEVGEVVLRTKPYRVVISASLANSHIDGGYPNLDRARADDRIVAHVLEDGRAALVSDDRGPRIKLSAHGGVAYSPPAAFRLPVEESDLEKENRRLKAELKALENERPKMTIKLLYSGDPIVLKKPVLPPLAEDIGLNIIKRFLAANPKMRRTSDEWADSPARHRHFDWQRYERDYERFVKDLPAHIATIHHRLNGLPVALPLEFEIINAGRATLQNANVSIRVDGPARLLVERADEGDDLDGDDDMFDFAFPLPPMAFSAVGRPRMKSMARRCMKIPLLPGSLTFEWDKVPDEDDPRRANLSNREFRVGKRHRDTIYVVPAIHPPSDVTLNFDLEATQLDEVCHHEFRVRFELEEREWTLDDLQRLDAL